MFSIDNFQREFCGCDKLDTDIQCLLVVNTGWKFHLLQCHEFLRELSFAFSEFSFNSEN